MLVVAEEEDIIHQTLEEWVVKVEEQLGEMRGVIHLIAEVVELHNLLVVLVDHLMVMLEVLFKVVMVLMETAVVAVEVIMVVVEVQLELLMAAAVEGLDI